MTAVEEHKKKIAAKLMSVQISVHPSDGSPLPWDEKRDDRRSPVIQFSDHWEKSDSSSIDNVAPGGMQ